MAEVSDLLCSAFIETHTTWFVGVYHKADVLYKNDQYEPEDQNGKHYLPLHLSIMRIYKSINLSCIDFLILYVKQTWFLKHALQN